MKGQFESSDIPTVIIGGLMLWVGWLFFNAASGYEIVDYESNAVPQLIVLNTFIAPSTAAMTFAIFSWSDFSNVT